MKVHALARWPHLGEHLAAIHRHLNDDIRGEFIVDRQARANKAWGPKDIVMVASYLDIEAARGRPVIYVEHGAGQRYEGANPRAARYYHGSDHPENVIGYICPRQDVADSWGRPAIAVGSPICDPYELYAPERCAAITFHWNGAAPDKVGVPEAGTALEHYVNDLGRIVDALRRDGYEVLAHGHPRFNHMHSVWKKLGMTMVSADEVRRRAQLLIADNTSLMYEMSYLMRDVVALNAPWYRRDVDHGLRFWSHVPGTQVDGPDELIELLEYHDGFWDPNVIGYTYGKSISDGYDGQRAAAWVTMQASSI